LFAEALQMRISVSNQILLALWGVALLVSFVCPSPQLDLDEPRQPSPETTLVGGAPKYTYKVIQTYPHDTKAFTEGLQYDVDNENTLLESTGLYSQSTVRKVNLTTGEVFQTVSIPEGNLFGEGITKFPDSGGNIFQLTWKARKVFLRDFNTLKIINQFTNPAKQGWGLTNNGTSLIMSDGTPTLWFLDPKTFTSQGSVQVQNGGKPVYSINELEYIQGYVWANVWLTNKIIVIDPANGNVTAIVDLAGILNPPSGDVLNGIAFDPICDRLFVTGKLWPKLFQVTIPGLFPPSRSGSPRMNNHHPAYFNSYYHQFVPGNYTCQNNTISL